MFHKTKDPLNKNVVEISMPQIYLLVVPKYPNIIRPESFNPAKRRHCDLHKQKRHPQIENNLIHSKLTVKPT